MVQRRNQSEHDYLVAQLAALLREKGFTEIKADLHGWEQPGMIWWKGREQDAMIPDATAEQNGVLHIFEVETDDTITIEHTVDQWRLFSAYAKQNNGRFIVVVPQASRQAAEAQIQKLAIIAEVWT